MNMFSKFCWGIAEGYLAHCAVVAACVMPIYSVDRQTSFECEDLMNNYDEYNSARSNTRVNCDLLDKDYAPSLVGNVELSLEALRWVSVFEDQICKVCCPHGLDDLQHLVGALQERNIFFEKNEKLETLNKRSRGRDHTEFASAQADFSAERQRQLGTVTLVIAQYEGIDHDCSIAEYIRDSVERLRQFKQMFLEEG
jgi:hypothetical protein